jgi:hypothetical protein
VVGFELADGVPEGAALVLGADETDGTLDGTWLGACKLGAREGAILGTVLGTSLFDGLGLPVGVPEGWILWLGAEDKERAAEGVLLGE